MNLKENGRHGVDELSIFQMVWAVIFLIVSIFTGKTASGIFSFLSIYLLILSTYRILSKKEMERNSENYAFMAKVLNPIKNSFKKAKPKKKDKNYKYIKCKNCGQELRVPKGKGKIKVKCPKCGEQFEERT